MVRRIGRAAALSAFGLVITISLYGRQAQDSPLHFVTADQCMACHNGLVTPSGEEISIGFGWRPSMMANAARDPYWQGAVRREVLEHPQAREEIENKCSTCHMPMAHSLARSRGELSDVFSHLPVKQRDNYYDRLAADGTSCTMCHQILGEGLGTEESFTGGFKVNKTSRSGQRQVFGPYEVDPGRQQIMRSASGFQPHQAGHLATSEFCASCHTLITHALGPNGEVLGELPEQVPYLEWKHSEYRGSRTCQSCHMPNVEEDVRVSSVMGVPREGFSRHAFRGGNFVMPRVFNQHRNELGVVALPQELESSARNTLEHLATDTARISIDSLQIVGERLHALLSVDNLAGHKLPTAYPSRRVWIRFSVKSRSGEQVFESGGFRKDGSIRGNDNDSDPKLYERHYERISSSEEVQIYEVIMVDYEGRVTTGLLSGLRYTKDNRLLPSGFSKETADSNIAVHGNASSDDSFRASGDQIEYVVKLNPALGPYTVEAELWYQPIGHRWAQNFRSFEDFETVRFVNYFESVAASSATVLARDEVSISMADSQLTSRR